MSARIVCDGCNDIIVERTGRRLHLDAMEDRLGWCDEGYDFCSVECIGTWAAERLR